MKTTVRKLIIFFCCIFIANSAATQIKNTAEEQVDTLLAVPFVIQTASEGETSEVEIPTVIPPSPQSQIFEKYVNHAITEYNGLPEITIPLYEIEIKGLKIPIALTYHASGIKYKQHDGEVGAGWSINAGGYRITRTVKGLDDFSYDYHGFDDFEENYKTFRNRLEQDWYLASMLFFDAKTSILRNMNYRDGEHDIFTYMTPSTNGHFVISERISRLRFTTAPFGGTLDKVTINKNIGEVTDGNGFYYIFGGYNQFDNESIQLARDRFETTAWPLKKIKSPYNESVSFHYKTYRYNTERYSKELRSGLTVSDAATLHQAPGVMPLPGANCDIHGLQTDMDWDLNFRSSKDERHAYSPFITKIESEKEIVYFERIDLDSELNTPTLISRIVITDKTGDTIKVVTFTYNYDVGSFPTDNETNWHILLNSVKIGAKNATEKEYLLKYNTASQSGPDYWNFYGGPNTGGCKAVIPESLGSHQYTPYRRFQVMDAARITLKDRYPHTVFVNRFPHPSPTSVDAAAFSLRKIIFPTGGCTEYEYEKNRYTAGIEVIHGAGMRIKKMTSYESSSDANPIITVFKYGKNEDGIGSSNATVADHFFYKESNHIYFARNYGCSYIGKYYSRAYTNNISSDISYDAFNVYYPEVTTYHNKGKDGKVISSYEIPIMNSGSLTSSIYKPGLNPILRGKKSYTFNTEYSSENDLRYLLVQEEKYQYEKVIGQSFNDMKVEQTLFTSGDYFFEYNYENRNNLWNHVYADWIKLPPMFKTSVHTVVDEFYLLEKRDIIHYNNDNTGSIISSGATYTYDRLHRLHSSEEHSSQGGTLRTTYAYPSDGSYLTELNMLNTVVEKTVYNINNDGQEVKRIKTNYPDSNSLLPLPMSVDYSMGGNPLEREVTYNLYDGRNGNLLQYTGRDEVPVSFLWGYNHQYPIVKVVGATHSDVLDALFPLYGEDQHLLTYDDIWQAHLSLRNQLPNAHIFGYSYKPLVGLTSEISPDGITTFYKYDTFGRLSKVLDSHQQVLKQYDYHYVDHSPVEPTAPREPVDSDKWIGADIVTISVDKIPSSGGDVKGDGKHTKNTLVALTAIPSRNYTFKGWYENPDNISSDNLKDYDKINSSPTYSFTATKHRRLIAGFQRISGSEYDINVVASPVEGGTVAGGGTYDSGSMITVSADENKGYVFLGWYNHGTKLSSDFHYKFVVTEDLELEAIFKVEK